MIHQDNPLDSFFPFDPYLLTRSKVFIDNLYQNYNSAGNDDDDDDDDDDDEEEEEEDEEMLTDDDDNGMAESDEDVKTRYHNPWSEDDEI